MSGFFGIVREDGQHVSERLLEEAAEALRVRGPDGVSIWREGRLGGCFAKNANGSGKASGRNAVRNRDHRAKEFHDLWKVVGTVPVRRIFAHEDPSKIGDLCALILADAARVLGSVNV